MGKKQVWGSVVFILEIYGNLKLACVVNVCFLIEVGNIKTFH